MAPMDRGKMIHFPLIIIIIDFGGMMLNADVSYFYDSIFYERVARKARA